MPPGEGREKADGRDSNTLDFIGLQKSITGSPAILGHGSCLIGYRSRLVFCLTLIHWRRRNRFASSKADSAKSP